MLLVESNPDKWAKHLRKEPVVEKYPNGSLLDRRA